MPLGVGDELGEFQSLAGDDVAEFPDLGLVFVQDGAVPGDQLDRLEAESCDTRDRLLVGVHSNGQIHAPNFIVGPSLSQQRLRIW